MSTRSQFDLKPQKKKSRVRKEILWIPSYRFSVRRAPATSRSSASDRSNNYYLKKETVSLRPYGEMNSSRVCMSSRGGGGLWKISIKVRARNLSLRYISQTLRWVWNSFQCTCTWGVSSSRVPAFAQPPHRIISNKFLLFPSHPIRMDMLTRTRSISSPNNPLWPNL